jgi:hypothetical protein
MSTTAVARTGRAIRHCCDDALLVDDGVMDKRKFCLMHRLRKGRSDEQGIWLRSPYWPPSIFLSDESGTHFRYPDIRSMRLDGWINNSPVAA